MRNPSFEREENREVAKRSRMAVASRPSSAQQDSKLNTLGSRRPIQRSTSRRRCWSRPVRSSIALISIAPASRRGPRAG